MPTRLELYFLGNTAAGRAALANAQRLCPDSLRGTRELVALDLANSPLAGAEAGVLVTPTLLCRDERGERRVFGDLADLAAVARALGLEAPTL